MKEFLDDLHVQLFEELGEYSHRGIQSHDDLDIVKDLLESIKNIHCIKEYMDKDTQREKGDMGQEPYYMGESNRQSYMARSYAAPYMGQSRMNSYMDEMREQSYGNGRSYNYNSYYDPRYREVSYTNTPAMRGYSEATKEEMVDNLKKMADETNYKEFKDAITACVAKLEK